MRFVNLFDIICVVEICISTLGTLYPAADNQTRQGASGTKPYLQFVAVTRMFR